MMNLNQLAYDRCQTLLASPSAAHVSISHPPCGTRVVDCGVAVPGGLEVGRGLAEVCLAGLGDVQFQQGIGDYPGPHVAVRTDSPVAACLASQYAGWQVAHEKYFGMGSGPMRAARGEEVLFDAIGWREEADLVLGVLESAQLPSDGVCRYIADKCRVEPRNLTLLVAPTASIAGAVQIVARSIETCLHKLHELKFDVSRLVAGFGTAPLPPVAPNDLAGIGRTNDAILYGGVVTLWSRGDDQSLEEIGPQVPSMSSRDHGVPFAEIFERYGRDFYQIDPLLFSPAVVNLVNLDTGSFFQFGEVRPDILRRSLS